MLSDFLTEFIKLPVIYKFDEFEVRDINLLNYESEIVDKFFSEYSEIMNDCLFNFNEDVFVEISIEKSCTYANNFMDEDDIFNFLENNVISEDDSPDSFEELIPKYKEDIKLILEDNEIIAQIFWNYWTENLPEELHNKSLFISWYSKEYNSDWKSLKELNKKLSL